MEQLRSRSKSQFWPLLLFVFLLIFPKAGFKIGSLPVTIGYLSLAAISVFSLFQRRYTLTFPRLTSLILLIPFQISLLITAFFYGVENGDHFLGVVVASTIIPWLFLGLLSEFIDSIEPASIVKWFRYGIFFLALYGIFVFSCWVITGKLVVIPFLSVNIHDIDSIVQEKSNLRGLFLKLMSTYQNGILYGVSLLMLLPLYELAESSKWRRGVVKLSLFLTLSRTVWIGLLIHELFLLFSQKKWTFRHVFWFVLQIGGGVGLTIWFLSCVGFEHTFIFDPSLGGRARQFDVFEHVSLLGRPFTAFLEILYLAVLDQFGIIGLMTFLVALTPPLIQYFLRRNRYQDPFRKACATGLLLYLIIAASDGAFQYIPVMAIYWGVASLLLSPRQAVEVPG